MEKKTDSLGLLVHDAAREIRKAFEKRAQSLGLSSAQWRLLVHLTRGGPATQARLAELLEVEPISVSRLVDRMAAAGWVTRQPDPNDRRARIVTPTDQMRAAHDRLREMADGVYAEALRGLAPDEAATLIRGLRQITENLSETAARGAVEEN